MNVTPRLAAVVATAAMAVLPAVALPASATAAPLAPKAASGEHGIGIRLLDASVTRKDDPRARIYIDDFMRPGSTITRHVQVSDFTSDPVTLHVYAVASAIGDSGWDVADGHAANELTSWMAVTPSTVSLQPGRSATVTVTIDVPARASKGERYATVVAELPARSAPGQSVAVASRVGVRVYLDVGDGGEPASDFAISTLTAARAPDGTPTVSARVTNTGGRALDLGGKLQLLRGPGGLRAGPFEVQVPRTLGIGQTGNVVVELDKQTPVGPWLAKLTLHSGFVTHAVTGRLSFPAHAGTAATPVKAHPVPLAKNRSVLVPVAVGLILALLAGILLFLLWRRRRRDDDDRQPPAGGPPSLPAPRRAGDDAVATRSNPVQ